MRLVFWVVFAVSVLCVFGGLTFFAVPEVPTVTQDDLAAWFETMMIWAGIVGAVTGAVGGIAARRAIRHKPHEHAATFLARVCAWGFWTQVTAGVLAAAAAIAIASIGVLGPLTVGEKMALLVGSLQFLSVIGAGVGAASVTFLIITAARAWGGQFALLQRAA